MGGLPRPLALLCERQGWRANGENVGSEPDFDERLYQSV
jgi:hypothetical protein